jgi:hypothetical protein
MLFVPEEDLLPFQEKPEKIRVISIKPLKFFILRRYFRINFLTEIKKVIKRSAINFSCEGTGKQTYRIGGVATAAGAEAQSKPPGA